MKKFKWVWFILVGALVIGSGVLLHRKISQDKLAANYRFTSTPTIFVHGYRGNFNSEKDLMTDIEAKGIGHHQLTVIVNRSGEFTFKGKLQKDQPNPLIAVVFKDNTAGEVAYAKWLLALMPVLKQKYDIQNFNAVGHSMGAVAWVLYAMGQTKAAQNPTMEKLVTIAGPFDGILGWDDQVNRNRTVGKTQKPYYQTELFKLMVQNRYNFSKHTAVLNIYSDLKDGTHSDGTVSLVSARSLDYLIKDHVTDYQSIKITGPKAKHSALHQHNKAVNQALIDFLWRK